MQQGGELSDAEVVRRIVEENAADAFQVLVMRYQRYAGRIAWSAAGNRADAEELAEELWGHALLSLLRWREGGSLGAYLRAVMARKAVDWARRRRTRGPQSSLEELRESGFEPRDRGRSPEQSVIVQDDRLAECLGKLANHDWRNALELALLDYGNIEIAAALATSPQTVGTWLHRGRSALAKCLKRRSRR